MPKPVIEGHLRPTELASGIISMIDTYRDLGVSDRESQSQRDQLADAIASSLETLIDNQGMVVAFEMLTEEAREWFE